MHEYILVIFVIVGAVLYSLHVLSYMILKARIVKSRVWGLNVACGKTDGGGVNADIVVHADLPRMVIVDIEHLPFRDDAFDTVLSSHTLEHVERPKAVFAELDRVGESVTVVIPPLWDLWALVNVWEHRWIFLSFNKVHHQLPPYVPLPLARKVQALLGQIIKA